MTPKRKKNPDQTLIYLNLRLIYEREQNGVEPLFLLVFFFFVRFKSDENNILQLTIHLFSNRPTYYLLFD